MFMSRFTLNFMPEIKDMEFIKPKPPIDEVFVQKLDESLNAFKCMSCPKDCHDRLIDTQLIPRTKRAQELFDEIRILVDVGMDYYTASNIVAEYMAANNNIQLPNNINNPKMLI